MEIRPRSRTASGTDRRRRPFGVAAEFWIGALLILLTLAVYAQTRHFGFVNFDDIPYLLENPRLQVGLTPANAVWAFRFHGASYWHPLTWLSFMLDVALFGVQPGLMHLVNVCLHAAGGILLFLFLKGATGALWPSAFTAACFLLHPLNVESVAWIVERKTVLSGCLGLAALAAYGRYTRTGGRGTYAAALALFTLGCLAKPSLVVLPFLLPVLDAWPLRRPRPPYLREKIPFLAVSAAVTALVLLSASNATMAVTGRPLSLRAANALVAAVVYIGKTLRPAGLACFYPYPQTVPVWRAAGAFALLAGTTLALAAGARRRPWLLAGWLWYGLTLAPVAGLVQTGLWPAFADRFAYLPLIGLLIMAAWESAAILARLPRGRGAGAVPAVLVLTALAALTYRQAGFWRNGVTLFGRAVRVTPDSHLAHNNLGNALTAQGYWREAAEHYRESIRLEPGYVPPYNNLGVVLARQGNTAAAERWFRRVLQADPANADALGNLGTLLLQERRYREAVDVLRRAVAAAPAQAHLRQHLALALDAAPAEPAPPGPAP
ncbi:MAG: tetratricopeptide repeat protein [Lentisphaerae bacterium]|nr:tetratricopeptide repeat protein [Lentisphaerota bacterium]